MVTFNLLYTYTKQNFDISISYNGQWSLIGSSIEQPVGLKPTIIRISQELSHRKVAPFSEAFRDYWKLSHLC